MLHFLQSDLFMVASGALAIGWKPKQAQIDPIFWKALDSPFNCLSSLFFD